MIASFGEQIELLKWCASKSLKNINNMKSSVLRIGFLLIGMALGKCTNKHELKEILIKGNLKGLPDGELTILNRNREVIASQTTHNGQFKLLIPTEKDFESIFIQMEHLDKSNWKRLFQFETMIVSQQGRMQSQYLMLEDSIIISGYLKEFKPISIKMYDKYKLVYPDRPIITGRQTQVMYNDSLGFATINKISKIKELVKEHPYSYYYLYELKKRVASFSNEQFLSILNCFDKDVQESKTGRELREYVENRDSKKLDAETLLVDASGKTQTVLKKGATLNMVVLWASWCGPCRAEIPQLKKLYEQFSANPSFNIVSVSIDEDKQKWIDALEKEKMKWQQLLITPETKTYSKELFSFEGSIPTTLFVDSQGKIIKKYVGYDEKSLVEFTALIEKHTNISN